MVIINLFISLFYFCFSYDIIPIKNFEPKFISLTPSKNFTILSYYHMDWRSSYFFHFRLRRYYFSSITKSHYIYLYENISDIKQNESGIFVNYKSTQNFGGKDDIFYFRETRSINITYYLVIQNDYSVKDDHSFIVEFYASETPVNISHMIQARIKHDPFWTNFIYLFRIPLNHEKYLLFEYDDFNSGNNVIFTISENGNVTVYENTTLRQEGYLELKNECTYNIRIKINIAGYPRKSTDVYFRLVQSKYIKYLPVEINTEYFLYYRVIKPTYLLLNMSTIEKGNKMMIEYNKNWGKEYKGGNDFIIYGYNTINEYTINDKSGKELELIESEDYDYICRTFIHKNSEDIKLVLFKIQFNAYDFSDTIFSIRYGKQEKYYPKTIYLSFGIGLILSIPNIIVLIIACYKKIEIPTYFTFILDISLHLAESNIISKFLYLGGDSSFYVGLGFLGIYIILFILQIIFKYFSKITIFNVFIGLSKKSKNMRTFEEAFNERRKLPPQIIVVAKVPPNDNNYYPINDIYNENSNGKIEMEYEYCSWEDNTDFILDKESAILECQFGFEVNLNKETADDLEIFKKGIKNASEYYENILCPGLKCYEVCSLKPKKFYEKYLPILWFIFLLIGYLNILDTFFYYKIDKIYIRIKKIISNTNSYRTCYKKNDENLESYKILNGKPKNESFYTIDSNNQPLLD